MAFFYAVPVSRNCMHSIHNIHNIHLLHCAADPSAAGSIKGIRLGASTVSNCTGSALVKS